MFVPVEKIVQKVYVVDIFLGSWQAYIMVQ